MITISHCLTANECQKTSCFRVSVVHNRWQQLSVVLSKIVCLGAELYLINTNTLFPCFVDCLAAAASKGNRSETVLLTTSLFFKSNDTLGLFLCYFGFLLPICCHGAVIITLLSIKYY